MLAVGNASGALISGVIYDLFGSYHYAMMACMCFYLIAILTFFLTGEPREYPGGAPATEAAAG